MGRPFPTTARQSQLLRFIAGFIDCAGRAPSIRAMQQGLGMVRTSTVFGMLTDLEERGHIRRPRTGPHGTRAIELVHHVPVPRAPDGAPLYFVAVKSRVDHGDTNA